MATMNWKEDDPLEQHFRERQRLLDTILQDGGGVSTSASFRRQLQARERHVRRRTLQEAAANNTATERQRIRYQRDAVHQDLLLQTTSHASPTNATTSWYDSLVLEWHVGIMAMMSLWLHCGAYVGIGHWVDAISEPFGISGWVCGALLGLVALIATGDLTWWLDDITAECVEMDWENRVFLLQSKMNKGSSNDFSSMFLRWCIWLREQKVLRAAVFILAYTYCMESCVYVVQLMELFWLGHDDWDAVVASLPSVRYEQDYGTCETEHRTDISFCSARCQQEINDADRLETTLQQEDLFHTWDLLPEADYEEFWYSYLVSEDPVRVQTAMHSVLFWSMAIVVATTVLWRCLGCKLWFKY